MASIFDEIDAIEVSSASIFDEIDAIDTRNLDRRTPDFGQSDSTTQQPIEEQAPRPKLGERFYENARAGFSESLTGRFARVPVPFGGGVTFGQVGKMSPGGINALGGLYQALDTPATTEEERIRREQYEAMPGAEGVAERAAAIGGFIAGTTPSPENIIPVGRGATLLKTAAKGAATIGGLNVALDTIAQAQDIEEGLQDEFSFERLAFSAGAGAVIGGLANATPQALGRAKELIKKRLASPNITPENAAKLREIEQGITDLENAKAPTGDKPVSTAAEISPIDQPGRPLDGIPEPTISEPVSLAPKIKSTSDMPASELMSILTAEEGGVTGSAHRLGLSLKLPEELDALRSARAASAVRSAELRAAKNFDDGVLEATKGQYFQEAIDAATGTSGARNAILSENPNAVFPFDEATTKPATSRMSSEAGNIGIVPLSSVAGAGVGGVIGSTQGDTPEERINNMMLGVGIGATGGAALGRLAKTRRLTPSQRASRALQQVQDSVAGTKDVPVAQRGHSDKALKQIKSKAVGTEGMPNWYLNLRETAPMVAVRTAIRNRASVVKDVVSRVARSGAEIADEDNPNLAVRLFPGRVKAEFDSIKTLMVDSERALRDAAKSAGLDSDDIPEQYADYMRAKHAAAYNKYTDNPTAAGMTDDEATAVVAKYKEAGLDKFFDDFAQIDRATIEATRDILRKGGVISEEQIDWMRKNAPDYVPMNRELDIDVIGGVGGGPGFNVAGSGVRKATGSDRPFSDLRGNIMANLIDATMRAEKNIVDQATANFFRKNPVPGVVVRKPKVVGTRKTSGGREIPIYEDAGPSTVVFREEGKPVFIDFQDPKMADAFGNLRPDEMGVVARWIGNATRMFSGLVTRFNPDFWFPNLIRDRQEAFANHLSLGDWRGAFAQISPATRGGIAENMRGIMDHVQNIDTDDAKLYRQMIADGGTSGGYGLSTREDIVKTVEKIRAKMDAKNPITKTDWLRFVDVVNELSENSTRLGAYRRALQVGATRKEAALAARDASIDFDMKGKLTREFATAWAFFNPATQGPVNFTKAQIRNPKAAAAVLGTVAGLSIALNEINKSQDPDWKQKPGLKFANQTGFPMVYGKDPETGDLLYVTIPIAQSMRPFKAVIDLGVDSVSGDVKDWKQALKETASIILEQNPTGSQKGDPLSTLAPTLARPFVDIAQNTDYAGRPIYPQFFEGRPEIAMKARMYSSTMDTPIGKMAIQMSALADSLGADVSPEHISYLLSQYSGGPGRTAQKMTDLAGAALGDGEIERRNIPIASSFVKSIRSETSERSTEEYKNAYEAFSNAQTASTMMRTEAYNLFGKIKDRPTNEWIAALKEEWQKGDAGKMPDGSMDPRFAKTMFNIFVSELKGESATDSIIRQMGVEDGTRARYYNDRLRGMTVDEKRAFIAEQLQKGLLSEDVLQQLAVLQQLSRGGTGNN